MLLARRAYLYFISAVSLATLAVGFTNLLDLLFRWTWERVSGASIVSADPDEIRRQLSIHVALIVVSLPIWLLHWWLVERAVNRPDGRSQERESAVRALYLTAGLAIPFVFWIVNAIRLIEESARRLLGSEREHWYRTDVESALAILIVSGAIWAFHVWTRSRDESVSDLRGASEWLPRLYLLSAAATGALLALSGLAELLALVAESIVGDQSAVIEGNIWKGIIADTLGLIVVGLIAWMLHWGYVQRSLSNGSHRSRSLAQSSLVYVYVYALALTGVFATLLFAGSALEALIGKLLVAPSTAEPFAMRVVEPLARALPFAAIWIYHRGVVLNRQQSREPVAARDALQRVYTYAIAFAGLCVGAYGIASALFLAFDLVLEPRQRIIDLSDTSRSDLSNAVALTIVGSATWLWHWYRVQTQLQSDPLSERAATPRRVYLLTSIAATVVALLGSLAVMLYRLLAVLLGVADAGLRTDLSAPVAIAIVASAILAYHGVLLRGDLVARPLPGTRVEEFTIIVTAPAGTRSEDVTKTIRRSLPEGFDVRER